MPGRYDIPFHPRARDGWFRVANIDVTTSAALVGVAILSMVAYAIDKVLLDRLTLIGPAVRDGELWRVVTWPMVNPPDSFFIFIVLGLLFLWFVGHEVEEMIGRHRFTLLILLMTVVPAVLVCLSGTLARSTDAYGFYELDMGLLAIVALHQPNRPFFFGIPAWIVGAVYAFLTFVRLAGERLWGNLILVVLVIAVAAIVMRRFGYLEDTMGWLPSGATKRKKRPGRSRSQNKVVPGPWSAPTEAAPPADAAAAQAELDTLLDKISAGGLDSLTGDEKRRLNELSKRLR